MIQEFFIFFGGGILGWLASYLAGNANAMAQQDVVLVDDVIQDLRELEELVFHYWLLPKDDSAADKLAVRISALQHSIGVYEEHLCRILGNAAFKKYRYLSIEFFTKATGGDFATRSRLPSKERAAEVLELSLMLRKHLRVSRRNTFWAR